MFMQNSEETFLRWWRGALVTAVDVVCTGGEARKSDDVVYGVYESLNRISITQVRY